MAFVLHFLNLWDMYISPITGQSRKAFNQGHRIVIGIKKETGNFSAFPLNNVIFCSLCYLGFIDFTVVFIDITVVMKKSLNYKDERDLEIIWVPVPCPKPFHLRGVTYHRHPLSPSVGLCLTTTAVVHKHAEWEIPFMYK